jgi:K(+)-stimulated pyrophosphate-energized sodium pump
MKEISDFFWLIPVAAVIALVFAYIFFKDMMKNSEGTPRMKEIAMIMTAQYIQEL